LRGKSTSAFCKATPVAAQQTRQSRNEKKCATKGNGVEAVFPFAGLSQAGSTDAVHRLKPLARQGLSIAAAALPHQFLENTPKSRKPMRLHHINFRHGVVADMSFLVMLNLRYKQAEVHDDSPSIDLDSRKPAAQSSNARSRVAQWACLLPLVNECCHEDDEIIFTFRHNAPFLRLLIALTISVLECRPKTCTGSILDTEAIAFAAPLMRRRGLIEKTSNAYSRPIGGRRKHAPATVVMPKEKQRSRTRRQRGFHADVTPPAKPCPAEFGDTNGRRHAWGKPFFDQRA
jgi:hypothetical protein